jgi:hypothetical protein
MGGSICYSWTPRKRLTQSGEKYNAAFSLNLGMTMKLVTVQVGKYVNYAISGFQNSSSTSLQM